MAKMEEGEEEPDESIASERKTTERERNNSPLSSFSLLLLLSFSFSRLLPLRAATHPSRQWRNYPKASNAKREGESKNNQPLAQVPLRGARHRTRRRTHCCGCHRSQHTTTTTTGTA